MSLSCFQDLSGLRGATGCFDDGFIAVYRELGIDRSQTETPIIQ